MGYPRHRLGRRVGSEQRIGTAGAVSADYVFLPRVLSEARPAPYTSAMLGKWHLGFRVRGWP